MLLEREASDMPRVWRKDMDHSLLKWERQAQCCLGYVVSTLLVLALVLECEGTALGQNASAPTAGDERIIIVMSDGTSSVHRLGDQRLKVLTAAGESEIPLSKIVYIYHGKARLYSEKGVISGEVMDGSLAVQTDDGSAKHIPIGEMLFMSPVQGELSGKLISKLEIVVADGKVTKHVSWAHAPSSPLGVKSDKPLPAANSRPVTTPALAPPRWVTILDDHSADRLFEISKPSHNTVVKKVARANPYEPFQGPPFVVEFDILKLPTNGNAKALSCALNIRSTVRPGGGSSETICYGMPRWDRSLVPGTKTRIKDEFNCLVGLEGSGEVYLYVVDRGNKEDQERERIDRVQLYKTVSNVLRIPVRFE